MVRLNQASLKSSAQAQRQPHGHRGAHIDMIGAQQTWVIFPFGEPCPFQHRIRLKMERTQNEGVCLSFCSHDPSTSSSHKTISTMNRSLVDIPLHGLVQGVLDERKNVIKFLNIPYATVLKRWRKASPVVSWQGIRDATRPGYILAFKIILKNGLQGYVPCTIFLTF